MNKLSQFFLVVIIFFLLVQSGCKKNPVEPEFKNPREYVWEATKLAYPNSGQTQMYSIWGSSPSNVYVSGFNSLGGYGAMYHFDGKQWQPVRLPSGGNIWDYNYLWEMMGFGENDIWVAGWKWYVDPDNPAKLLDSAGILHYDGGSWKQMLPTHMGVRGLKSIGGTSSQNLFFGSFDGKIIRYDGAKWSVDTLYLGLSVEGIGGDESRAFAVGNTYRGALDDSVMCFTRTSGRWSLIDMQLITQWDRSPRFGLTTIYIPIPGLYYSSAFQGIFRWDTDKWTKVFSDLYSGLIGLRGSQSNNILSVGWSGKSGGPVIYHWDGASWEEVKLPDALLQQLKGVELFDVWTNGREAFIVGNNGGVSYVLHGK